jgi:dipeptidyl aminopeptidase/acylaminoacyl peptidase
MRENKISPTIEDMISLTYPVGTRISSNGEKVAYSIRKANWNKNLYEFECFIYDIKSKKTFQITRDSVITDYQWINDNSLAILKKSAKDEQAKQQIWLYENLIGDGWQVTDHKRGVQSFKPFAQGIIYQGNNVERGEKEKRKTKFGTFVHFEEEESASALYYLNFEKMKDYYQKVKNTADKKEVEKIIKPIIEISKLLEEPVKIFSYQCSPNNDAIYLTCWPKDDLIHALDSVSFRITINPDEALEEYLRKSEDKQDEKEGKGNEEKKKDEEDYSYLGSILQFGFPKGVSIGKISPDGTKLLLYMKERDNMLYTISDAWILNLENSETILAKEQVRDKLKKLTGVLDRFLLQVEWKEHGIYIFHVEGTETRLKRFNEQGEFMEINIKNNEISTVINQLNFVGSDISDTGILSLIASSKDHFNEVYVSSKSITTDDYEMISITSYDDQIENWKIGTVETIQWSSKDGTIIQGVLRKPENFDPSKKYPLIFYVHGGPAAADCERLIVFRYYPIIQFLNKDILVLHPNYRGSVGRGQAFLELNKDNLGIGDLWDLESAIEYLDKEGFIDHSKVGCMGWSQGGYISAFVGIHSNKFKAISVGAGVSDWYTYHISNDIPFFTTHYLSTSPFRDRTLYEKTAPINKIKEAKTPALIQHGVKDLRVPISNAKELYRGFKEMGVHVELFIFPEMTHAISKPRENKAIMHQNLTWFSHHLLGEELDFDLK